MVGKKVEEQKLVQLSPLTTKIITFKIKGKTPLLMDKMSESVKEGILEKQLGKKSNKKKVRDIKMEVQDAIHKTSKGIIGFPASGFKRGMIESTSFVGDKFFSKKLVMGSVRIINSQDGLIPIKYKKQDILTHNVGSNTKFTPQFHDWEAELVIQYDSNNISPDDIGTLINYAGFYVGVGAWRPKSGGGGSGEYGCYSIA